MNIEQILSLLSDGELHSGEELGKALGVSRAAVWKKLKGLEDYGIEVESVKGKGYLLKGGLDLLDKEALVGALDCNLKKIEIATTIDSTNKYLLRECAAGEGDKSLCAAEMQTQGRGRRGKEWQSPFARNIYFSLGWEFQEGAKSLEGLSLAVGVCVARVLKSIGIDNASLKWPNDVLVDNRKIAGVLLEMTGDAAGVCQVVVGVGLNVSMSQLKMPLGIDQPWTDVWSNSKVKVPRNKLLADMVNELTAMLNEYETSGFSALKDEWQSLDICFDMPVTLTTPAMVITGTAKGVTDTGAIRINDGENVKEYSGGEISLRIAQ